MEQESERVSQVRKGGEWNSRQREQPVQRRGGKRKQRVLPALWQEIICGEGVYSPRGKQEQDAKGLDSHAKGSQTIFPGSWRDLRGGLRLGLHFRKVSILLLCGGWDGGGQETSDCRAW